MTRASTHIPLLRPWAAIGTVLLATVGCGSRDESLGCAELVVTCPEGAPKQRWWLARTGIATKVQPQDGECGRWLAYINNGAISRYPDIDLGYEAGQRRLRVLVAADDSATKGGELSLFADQNPETDPTATPITKCSIGTTGGWFNWLVVDCGALPLTGAHELTFKFEGTSQYVFNFAAFGVALADEPDCTVTGPKK